MSIKFPKEERTIVDLLFNNKKLLKKDFEKFDFEKFVKISSSHLILPLIFTKLKQKKLLKYLPKELEKYLKEIHNINLNRNKELIKETMIIIDILRKNEINYVILKGTANIFRNLYRDIGERMIGDIDILVESKDSEKTVKLLNEIGYYNLTDDIFFDFRHLKRIISKKKIFAVEIHTRLFDKYNNFINLKNIEKLDNAIVLKKHSSADYNIYNFQINDFGYLKTNYSYRSLYDHFLLSKDELFDRNKIISEKLKKRYFLIAKELGIENYNKYNLRGDILGLIRFRLRKKFKLYNNFDKIFSRIIIFVSYFPKKTLMLIKNGKYRRYLLKKIRVRLSPYFPI